jgi:hypothetical protein
VFRRPAAPARPLSRDLLLRRIAGLLNAEVDLGNARLLCECAREGSGDVQLSSYVNFAHGEGHLSIQGRLRVQLTPDRCLAHADASGLAGSLRFGGVELAVGPPGGDAPIVLEMLPVCGVVRACWGVAPAGPDSPG